MDKQKKSRALQARKYRRVQREKKRLMEMAMDDSSDEDMNIPHPISLQSSAKKQRLSSGTTSEEQDEFHYSSNTYENHHDTNDSSFAFNSENSQGLNENMLSANESFSSNDIPEGDILHSGVDNNTSHNDDIADSSPATNSDSDYGFRERPISTSDSPGSAVSSEDDLPLKDKIALFVCQYSLTVRATRELLALFRSAGVQGLPKDRRALLKPPRKVYDIDAKCGGLYKYIGLEKGLKNELENNPDFNPPNSTIYLKINIDGLPLRKSSGEQFWPILCQVDRMSPFIVGLYYGPNKPDSMDDFLDKFLEEYAMVRELGLSHANKRYNVDLMCWICDAPARSMLKCIKGHSGYYACERCNIKGERVEGKIVYPSNVAVHPRTDAGFAAKEYCTINGDNHQRAAEQTPLINAGINCVSDFVIDAMHNVYLGTWKRMLHMLLRGPRGVCRLSMNQVHQIDSKLLKCKLPSQFARSPRTIMELDRWKATELRSSLLYTGLVFLRGVVSQQIYRLYLKLCVAMNILHTENDTRRNAMLPLARRLILEFIQESPTLLGEDFAVYNVHCMSHVPDDVQHFQTSLNNINAFPFENYLQALKKMVKGPTNPLAQVCGRLEEMKEQNLYKSGKIISPHISANFKDSVFYLENEEEFAVVQEIDKDRVERIHVQVFSVNVTENLFHQPCQSKAVNIHVIRNFQTQRTIPRIVGREELVHKVTILPFESGSDFLLIPLVHGMINLIYCDS